MDDQELEGLYGPAAKYSDHGRGEQVTFIQEGMTHTGIIIWVSERGKIAGQHVPVHYIVEVGKPGSFPFFVLSGDILEEDQRNA